MFEAHLGREISVFTTRPQDPHEATDGLVRGHLRRISGEALEIRRPGGDLCYVSIKSIVRCVPR